MMYRQKPCRPFDFGKTSMRKQKKSEEKKKNGSVTGSRRPHDGTSFSEGT